MIYNHEQCDETCNELDSMSIGLCGGCEVCQLALGFNSQELEEGISNGTIPDEPSFSHSSCDTCGSSLGGNRYAAHYMDTDKQIGHLEICSDCVQYIANGELPAD